MRHSILIILTFATLTSSGQTDTSNLQKSFVEKTIEYYYNAPTNGQKSKPTFLILRDSSTTDLQTAYSTFNISFVTRDEAVDKISKTKNKAGQLDNISTKWVSVDTFDVSIAGWGVSVKKVNEVVQGQKIKYHSYFVAGCGGTLGYIPTCRFIYDKTNQSWTQLTDTEIRKEKLARQTSETN
jgi:hypothetical protein